MKKIPLTQGQFALVDDEDFYWLSKSKWYALRDGNTFYAVRNSKDSNGRAIKIIMHREILAIQGQSIHVDHANRNGLDNQRANIRECTPSQNRANSSISCNNKSGYKGVSYKKDKSKFVAQININRKRVFLGYFDNPEAAASAYDKAAKENYGIFAKTNL